MKWTLSGMQIAPHSLLDEGIGQCLDFVKDQAAVNTLFCYTQTYHAGGAPMNVLATDHPKPPRSVAGRRFPRLWTKMDRSPFKDLSIQHEPEDSSREYGDRDFFKELINTAHDRGIKELPKKGLSPDYVYREIKRCVDGAKGKARVYAGIGIDVPTYVPNGMERFPSKPEVVYEATRKAFEAGASGVIASREYDEMTLPNLRAYARAVREFS